MQKTEHNEIYCCIQDLKTFISRKKIGGFEIIMNKFQSPIKQNDRGLG